MSGRRSHVHSVFLPVELYVGIAKAQGGLEIGKSSAILLMINEGLFHRSFISRETYEVMKRKYERKLVEIVRRPQPSQLEAGPLTKEQVQEQKVVQAMQKRFSMVLEQWNLPRENIKQWKVHWVKEAEKWKGKVENAKLVLALANGEHTEYASIYSTALGKDGEDS